MALRSALEPCERMRRPAGCSSVATKWRRPPHVWQARTSIDQTRDSPFSHGEDAIPVSRESVGFAERSVTLVCGARRGGEARCARCAVRFRFGRCRWRRGRTCRWSRAWRWRARSPSAWAWARPRCRLRWCCRARRARGVRRRRIGTGGLVDGLRRHVDSGCRDGHRRDPGDHAGRRSQAVAAGIIMIVLGALWVARKVTIAPAPGSSR